MTDWETRMTPRPGYFFACPGFHGNSATVASPGTPRTTVPAGSSSGLLNRNGCSNIFLIIPQPEKRLDAAVGQFSSDLKRLSVRYCFRPQSIELERARKFEVAPDRDLLRGVRQRRHRRELRRCGQVLLLAFRCTALFPIHNQFQLFLGKTLVVAKIAESFYGAPRRHPPLQHFFADRLGPWTRYFVRLQGERRPAFAMAGNAMSIEQPDDLPVESDLGCNNVVAIGQTADGQHEEATSDHRRNKIVSHVVSMESLDLSAISIRDVTKVYEGGVEALRGVSLECAAGQVTALLGRSGCGKTTLLNLCGAMDFPTAGEVRIAGQVTSKLDDAGLTQLRRNKIGFVFQFFQLLPSLTALENVELPLLLSGAKNTEATALERLHWVGLDDKARALPYQLSGGQMQRVAIARALVHDPAVLIADEPTGQSR